MSAIITNKFRFSQAAAFISLFSDTGTNNIYIAVGKSTPWTTGDGAGVTENNTPVPTDTSAQDTKDFRQILGMKRIGQSNVSYVVPRQDWATGTVYTMYDDQNALLNTAGNYCYVINPNTYGVYKCIWNNNGGTSSVIPTGTSTAIFTTADNYQWKYMFTLLPADTATFLNTNWVPVRDRSNATLATDQAAVSAAAVNGGIHTIKIVNGGTGYTNGTYAVTGANVVGDGAGFVGSVTVSAGVITSASVTNPGTGYTTCTLTLPSMGAGTNGSIRAIISPSGGHGTDPVVELNAFYVMATTTLNTSESGILTVSNDYRKIFLLQNPLLANGGQQGVPGASVKSALVSVTYTGTPTGTFQLDETVSIGATGVTGVLVDHQPGTGTGVMYFTELSSTTIPTSGTLTGNTSTATVSFAAGAALPFFLSNSGRLIYKDYRKAIMRSADQTETLSTIVEF